MIKTLNVVTRLQDNGDGGYSIHIYNNTDELLANHPKARDGVLTEDQKEEILSGDNEYENGYIDSGTIQVNIEGDVATLAKPLYFHAGQ